MTVSASDALAHRAHEEHRPVTPPAPRTDPQLFPHSEAAFQRSCRWSEQQGLSHHEKILRFPKLSAAANLCSITHLANGPSRNRPMNSSDEPKNVTATRLAA